MSRNALDKACTKSASLSAVAGWASSGGGCVTFGPAGVAGVADCAKPGAAQSESGRRARLGRILAMREHAAFTVEARYRRHDGEYRLVRTDAQPRFDASGDFLGMIGVNVDITDTRRAEQALKESEERFRLIANSAPVPMWVSRLDGKRAFVNQAYMAFLTLGYEDCLVYDWRKALHPDDLQRILGEQIAGESSKMPFALEARYRRGDGEWRWLRSESQPRWGPAGEHIGFIGVAHDITAAKQAESELRGLNETLEAQVEARTRERDRIWNVSQDILMVADQNGVWLNASPAATARLGWSQAELVGRTTEWIEHPEDIAEGGVAHLAAGGINQRFENRLRHKDGSYRWLSWTAAAHEGLIYATARDVTDEKEAAETLRRTEEALRQSQKMEAVGQLTGGIAHDFNNLLQGIVGSLDLVQKRLADGRVGEIQRYVNGAMTSANRAAALTHRLLAFSRRQPLDPKPVRANPLIVSMEDLLRRTLGERIQLELALAADLWATLCDQNQLENSILNLAINARDAMPDSGTLRIETSNTRLDAKAAGGDRDMTPGDYVCICRHRHRDRHDTRRDGACLRSLLHHQANRAGHGPRPVDDLWVCAAVGRVRQNRQQGRQGHDGQPLPTTARPSGGCHSQRGVGGRPALLRAARRFSS